MTTSQKRGIPMGEIDFEDEKSVASASRDEILDIGLSGCGQCSHVPEQDIRRVRDEKVKVVWAKLYGGSYGPEHSMQALVELKEGYAVVTEGEDTTGHGCRCDGDIGFYKTLDDAIRLGVGEGNRAVVEGAIAEDKR